MFYITEANARKIIRQISWKNFSLNGQVYKQAIYFLNDLETQQLLGLQELLMNPKKFVKEVYHKAESWQNPDYIYPDRAPAYHYHTDCENMNSDYSNIIIPDEIKTQGEEVVREFRKWFIANDHLPEDLLMDRCRWKFGLKKPFKLVNHKNSGVQQFEFNDIFKLEEEINRRIKDAGRFYYASEKNATILKRFSKLAFIGLHEDPFSNYFNDTGYSDEEVKELLAEYELKYKRPVIRFLIEWYRIKYNPDLQFSQHILRDLGFKECSCCAKRSLSSEGNHFGFAHEHVRCGDAA